MEVLDPCGSVGVLQRARAPSFPLLNTYIPHVHFITALKARDHTDGQVRTEQHARGAVGRSSYGAAAPPARQRDGQARLFHVQRQPSLRVGTDEAPGGCGRMVGGPVGCVV